MNNIRTKAINALRILSADQVQKANSGHPGLPLGAAPIVYELYANHMNHTPNNPNWVNRDRFVLSAGHGSALLYSLLHLYGYGNLSIDDLKNFRQLDSLTPGHPEYGHTVGVEATTGPLGAGMGMAVGMAMAEAHLSSIFNKPNYSIVDHYTFVLGGDGCMMEGISSEAFSLAGTLKLGKLIVLYDSNSITIEGNTNIAFSEDVCKRMEAFGFQILKVDDANDVDALGKAIEEAKKDITRPSFIEIRSTIGYGSPVAGKAKSHGEPLGNDNIEILRENLGWSNKEPFVVDEDVYNHYKEIVEKNNDIEQKWNMLFDGYTKEYPEMRELWDKYFGKVKFEDIPSEFFNKDEKAMATRAVSGNLIQRLSDFMPNLFGGSADLAPSTKTFINDGGEFSADDYTGKNIHYGVRELAMAAIGNGILLHGGLRTFVSTFFVFSDYLKPMARLSALMSIPQIFVLTHDSIGVGEDGPTHEPIEQLSMLRAMPNFYTFRPADTVETAYSWAYAVSSDKVPSALVLSRQNLVQLDNSGEGVLRGAYILEDSNKALPDGIIMASGSEVELAVNARKELLKDGIDVRVVSVPCMDLFEEQDDEYKNKILPVEVDKRVSVEAGAILPWGRYVGLNGKSIGMTTFGASAPAEKLFEKFGFTVKNVVDTFKSL